MTSSTHAAVLATAWRGNACEMVVRGHVVVVTASGDVVASAGDPGHVTTLRSSIKPIQAMPLAEAASTIGLPDDELAVACSSHYAEEIHVETVRRLLARAGVDDAALHCGPQAPYDPMAAARHRLSGEPDRRIDNNCSGKHAGMLAACTALGLPADNYWERSHPLQQRIEAALSELSGCDVAGAPWGVDGCGLPTLALPLHGLARAFARGGNDARFAACARAMVAFPVLISGTGRFDSAVLGHLGGRFIAKSGAAAVWAGTVQPGGPGIAVKLEAGSTEHLAPIVLTAMSQLLGVDLPAELTALRDAPVRNREGAAIGDVRVSLGGLTDPAS